MSTLSVTDFSRFPAGRYKSDGPFSGESFRQRLVDELGRGESVIVQLDGTAGYGSSFLEEAFGGLVRSCGFTATDLHKRMQIASSDPSLIKEVWGYVDEATPDRKK